MFSLFQSLGTSSECHDFSNMMYSDPRTISASYLRSLGCISLGSMDYVHVPQMLSNLIFSCDGWAFIPPIPTLRLRHLRHVGGAITNED